MKYQILWEIKFQIIFMVKTYSYPLICFINRTSFEKVCQNIICIQFLLHRRNFATKIYFLEEQQVQSIIISTKPKIFYKFPKIYKMLKIRLKLTCFLRKLMTSVSGGRRRFDHWRPDDAHNCATLADVWKIS